MANKGIKHTGDPSIEGGVFPDPVPDKLWAVNGIEKVISTNDAEEPVFKVHQIFEREELRLSFEFRTASGEQGPACSVNVADFYGLVSAFPVRRGLPSAIPEHRR